MNSKINASDAMQIHDDQQIWESCNFIDFIVTIFAKREIFFA